MANDSSIQSIAQADVTGQVSIIILTFLHQRKKGLVNDMQINGPKATWKYGTVPTGKVLMIHFLELHNHSLMTSGSDTVLSRGRATAQKVETVSVRFYIEVKRGTYYPPCLSKGPQHW